MGKNSIRNTAVASRFENRTILFWGLSRNNIKFTSLYKYFVSNDRRISITKGDYVITLKNEILTQTHKDILEVLLLLRSPDSLEQTVCYQDIFNILKKSTHNCDWIYEILEELDNVNFHFSFNNDVDNKFFGILNNLSYNSETGQVSFLWDVSFISLYDQGDVFNYSKYTPFISKLNHDVTKQAVRWLLTFDNIQISLKKLIVDKLGFSNVVTSRSVSRYFNYIREEHKELEMFGISFDEKKNIISICRSNEDVSFFKGKDISSIADIVKKKKTKKQQLTMNLFELD